MSGKTLEAVLPIPASEPRFRTPDYRGEGAFVSGEARLVTFASVSAEFALWCILDAGDALVHDTVPSSPFPLELSIGQFGPSNGRLRLNPPLEVTCNLDEETGLYELEGPPPYDGVILYGETVREAIDILEKDVLTMFWEDCQNAESLKLSPGMLEIVADLHQRVVA